MIRVGGSGVSHSIRRTSSEVAGRAECSYKFSAKLGGEASPPSAELRLCRQPPRNTANGPSKINLKIQVQKTYTKSAQSRPKWSPKGIKNQQKTKKNYVKTHVGKQHEKMLKISDFTQAKTWFGYGIYRSNSMLALQTEGAKIVSKSDAKTP